MQGFLCQKKVEPTTVKGGEGFTGTGMPENDIFYFHPDHLTPVNICILESLNLVPRFGKYFVYYSPKWFYLTARGVHCFWRGFV